MDHLLLDPCRWFRFCLKVTLTNGTYLIGWFICILGLICILKRDFLTASPFYWSFFLLMYESLFFSQLPHFDRVSYIHCISGRDKIKNLCHLHDRPEKLASHLNIAKNWVIGYISDRRMGLLIYVKGNWIQVVLSLADVQHYFCQLVVKLKRDIFLKIETWNNNVLQHHLIMLSHEMDDVLMWKDANDTEFWNICWEWKRGWSFCSVVYCFYLKKIRNLRKSIFRKGVCV